MYPRNCTTTFKLKEEETEKNEKQTIGGNDNNLKQLVE